jgi:hypothetical protein
MSSWQSPNSKHYAKYGNKTREEITAMLETEEQNNRRMHKLIRDMVIGGDLQTANGNLSVYKLHKSLDSNVAVGLKAFFHEYSDYVGYGVLRDQRIVYCPSLRLAGTVDCMARASE